MDLAVRQGLSLYTADRARGTVDAAALATGGENSIVDAPAKKQQKGDFIFRWVPFFTKSLAQAVPDFGACAVWLPGCLVGPSILQSLTWQLVQAG